MRKLLFLFIFLTLLLPLQANTVLQTKTNEAQNILDKTISKIVHSWVMMKYHFELGNQRLRESAKAEKKKSQKKTEQQ